MAPMTMIHLPVSLFIGTKVNDAKEYPSLFAKEATGLQELRRNTTLIVPVPLHQGEIEGKQYLILNWLNAGIASTKGWQQFGNALAQMHQIAQPYFGFSDDNYIGSLYQPNQRCDTWHQFYGEFRILPLAKLLFEVAAFSKQDLKNAERLCESLEQRFPSEEPALLHGDLWSGNFLCGHNGEPVLIDPAVYYGHREMDIAMTQLFGGFSDEFYRGYNDVYQLKKDWQQRLPYSQLYPLLVHAVLFGGSYVRRCEDVFNSVAFSKR